MAKHYPYPSDGFLNRAISTSLPSSALVCKKTRTKDPEDEITNEALKEPQKIPEWCTTEALLARLKTQKIEDLDDYFAPRPIENPALEHVIYISPKARRRFKSRSESGNFAHLKDNSIAVKKGGKEQVIARLGKDDKSHAISSSDASVVHSKDHQRPEGQRERVMSEPEETSPRHPDDVQQSSFSLNDFEIGKVLGSGTFSTVFLAREKKSGFIVVLKIVPKKTLRKYHAERSLRSELEIQSHLKHPNIVRLFGYFDDIDNVYLILEFCMGGDIFNYARERYIDERLCAQYITQICHALNYMHKCLCIHRDIKLENIYLSEKGEIKIGDFGWACHSTSGKGEKVVGTINYVAPEMLEEPQYNYKVDNWAVGVLLFEMLTGESPFYGTHDEIEESIIAVNYKIPSHVSDGARDLIKRLLRRDPVKRYELSDVLNHPWILQNTNLISLKQQCLVVIERYRRRGYDFKLKDAKPEIRAQINMYHFEVTQQKRHYGRSPKK